MKNFIIILFFCLLAAFGIWAYKTPFSFCDIPVTYKLGNIDNRFNIKQSTALADIDAATKIIDLAYGKKIFKYSTESGELTINFVFDERKALENTINNQQSQIAKQDSTLQTKIDAYEADLKTFQRKMADLNATVQKYNNEGGAPPEVYNQLVNQSNELRSEADGLNLRAKQLNLETHNYNSNVKNLNQNVNSFNLALEQKPEEGLYDGANKTITIYFVNSKAELVHTLAHEFGHSIGMRHVDNPKAIMYQETSEYLGFTDTDKGELDRVCKSIPLTEYWLYKAELEFSNITKQLYLYLQTVRF